MRRLIVGLLLAVPLGAAPVSAQRATLGVAGGMSLANGGFHGDGSAGWHALVTLGVDRRMQPLGLRADLAHSRSELQAGVGVEAGERAVTSASLNLTYRLPMTRSPFSPYVIAGLGAYHTVCARVAECGDATRRGWNAGLGTRVMLVGVHAFAEARYHRSGTAEYVPITFGLRL